LIVMMIAVPLIVLGAYYALGWQAAVLLFPILFMSTGSAFSQNERTFRDAYWPPARVLATLVLFGIPISAVATGHDGIMRLWAYTTGIQLALMYARRKLFDGPRLPTPSEVWAKRKDVAVYLTGPALFILGSELIWVWSSMGGWIWYHAFGVPILFGLFTLLVFSFSDEWTVYRSALVDFELPPSAQGDDSDAAREVFRRQAGGEALRFENVSLSQFKAILGEIDWSGEDVPTTEYAQVERGKPETSIMVRFWEGQANIARDGDQTATVYWRYFEPSPLRVQGLLRHHYVRKVPLGLVAGVGDAIWADRWEEVGVLLADYAEPVEPKR